MNLELHILLSLVTYSFSNCMRKKETDPQISVAVRILLPSLALFLADHRLQRKTNTFNCILFCSIQILLITSKPDWQLTNSDLMSSISRRRQHIFANLH
jgi:hypothetical protein